MSPVARLPIAQDPERPRVRADCEMGERPCPWVTCRWHLADDWRGRGAPPETCALDVAEREGQTLAEVAAVLGVTRECVRQIESKAIARVAKLDRRLGLQLALLAEEDRDRRSGT